MNRRELLKILGLVGVLGACASPERRKGYARSSRPDPDGGRRGVDPRILVAYVWSFDGATGNIGDYAITPGLLNLLERHFPAYRLTVIGQDLPGGGPVSAPRGPFPGFPRCDVIDNAFAGEAYREALARLKRGGGGRLPALEDGDVDLVFDRFAGDLVDGLERFHPQILEDLRRTKLLVYNSGMILVYGPGTLAGTDFWGYTIRRSLPLLTAWKLGVPYGIYAHSFDSFGGPPGRPYLQRLLEDARFVFCRDGDSERYVRESGIRAPRLLFVPDSTLSFPGRDDDWARAFMAEHGLEPKRFLVVIPRTWRGGGVISSSIGERRSLDQLAKIRRIIEGWVGRTGGKVVIAAEVVKDLPNARTFVHDLLPEEVRKSCVMLPTHWNTERATSLYREARLLVTMEMHSFLLAVSVGTPAVVTAFRESGRKLAMTGDFGLDDWRFDIDAASAEEIGRVVQSIDDDHARQTARLEKDVLPRLRGLEDRALGILAGVLGGDSGK